MHLLPKILLLAFPGVIISTLLFGVAMPLTMFDNWDWKTSLLIGSILSATDPVSVVATLKKLGVDKKIGLLIEGESLVNDGSAIVLFYIILDSIQNTDNAKNFGAIIV